MRLGIYDTGMDSAGSRAASVTKNRRYAGMEQTDAAQKANGIWAAINNRVQAAEETGDKKMSVEDGETAEEEVAAGSRRLEAARIYEAATAGKANPIDKMRTAPKVPYGHLAKDGVIEYNGVVFVCDEKTNSICLGDMTDRSKVITVTLSGGGHLMVNRDCIGQLSKAAGMFSPEDLNMILRAIAQDTKIQSVKKEIDDMENSIGSAENAIAGSSEAAEDTRQNEELQEPEEPLQSEEHEKSGYEKQIW